MTELYACIAATLALDTVLIAALGWAYHAPRFAAHRLQPGPGMQVRFGHRVRATATIGVLSVAIVLGGTYVAFDHLVHARATPAWLVVVEALAILIAYDFAYYFAHRAMHHPIALRWVHGVHHRARNPSALESFYQHPLELVVGLSLLFGVTAALGPVPVRSFALAFFVYSTINIVVHAGMVTKVRLLAPIDWLIRKHHAHHHDDPRTGYSTLTVLPDLLFGTAGPARR